MVDRRDQVLMTLLLRDSWDSVTFFIRLPSMNGPFFNDRDIDSPKVRASVAAPAPGAG
jgi:hypothetical protein